MADEVDTRISPALDPGVISLIGDYDEDTRPLLGRAETALSEAYNALKGIHDAKAAAATNPTLNQFAQLIEVDNYATKRMGAVMKSWELAIDDVNERAIEFENRLRKPIEQKAVHSIATEIRAHFKSLPTGDRMTAIRRAIDQDDTVTVSAVLGTKSYLSGFEVEEIHDTFVREWQEKQMPIEAKKFRALRAASDLLNERVKILKKEWADAVGVVEETKEDRQGRKIVVKTWTPAEVREMVRKAKAPFAVPVGS